MVTDSIVNFGLTQQLHMAFGNDRLSLRIGEGDHIGMPKEKNFKSASDPFADPWDVVKKIDLAFTISAIEAGEENDRLGLPTPVGINGEIAHYFKGKKLDK